MGVFVTDSFTETSDVLLDSHSGELGATWTAHPHANYAGTTQFTVDAASDRLFATQTDALLASGTPPSADYYVEADFWHVSTISQNIAVCARMDPTADTMLIVRFNGGTIFEMRTIVAGAANTIGSSASNVPSVGNFTRGRFVVEGDQLSFYVYIAGVLQPTPIIGPITSALITAAGQAGVRNAGIASASTGMHLDNFEAGDLIVVPASGPSFRANSLRPAIFKPGRPR